MTENQAYRLTWGCDPASWLVYADWCEEQGQPSSAATWRHYGAVGLAVKGWIDAYLAGDPRKTPASVPLPGGRVLRGRVCKKSVRLSVERVHTLGPRRLVVNGVPLSFGGAEVLDHSADYILLKSHLRTPSYLRRRVIQIASNCPMKGA